MAFANRNERLGCDMKISIDIEIKGRIIWLSVLALLLAATLATWTSEGGDGAVVAQIFAPFACGLISIPGFIMWRIAGISEGVEVREDSETVIEICATWSLAMASGAMMLAIGMPILGDIGLVAAIGSGLGFSALFWWTLRGKMRPLAAYLVLGALPIVGMCVGFAISWIGGVWG